MTRPAEEPGTPLEPTRKRRPREMVTQDKIRLTGLLLEAPLRRGFALGASAGKRPQSQRAPRPRSWRATARLRCRAKKEGAHGGTLGSPVLKIRLTSLLHGASHYRPVTGWWTTGSIMGSCRRPREISQRDRGEAPTRDLVRGTGPPGNPSSPGWGAAGGRSHRRPFPAPPRHVMRHSGLTAIRSRILRRACPASQECRSSLACRRPGVRDFVRKSA